MDKREIYRQVGQLHAANINQGFLATLGVGFLALMYQAIDTCSSSVLLVEVQDDKVIGFISGASGMGPIYRQMLRYPISVIIALLPSLVRPKRLLKIFEILRYSRKQSVNQELPAAELLSIAVDPAYRGKQRADALYKRLVSHFKQAGVPAFKIIVGEALIPAHKFYRRMGAVPVTEVEVHEGQSSTVYVHSV